MFFRTIRERLIDCFEYYFIQVLGLKSKKITVPVDHTCHRNDDIRHSDINSPSRINR